MCGIAGTLDWNRQSAQPGEIKEMLRRLRHRGPDDSGVYRSRPPQKVTLGQNRLSIVDLSPAGRQPMHDESGNLTLICNGEIYNQVDLRKQLRQQHRFRSKCDVEVILHLYEERGAAFLPDLNGMFAFALWDESKEQLLLARDRAGIKPLYWTTMGGRFVFASEIKAILAARGVQARMDPVALAEHFTWQWTTGERTWFEGIHRLEPGHRLVVHADGRIDGPTRYFESNDEPAQVKSNAEWSEELRDCFTSAVTAQLMSDVPVGTYLSGGMDTGSISAVAGKSIDNLHTFTCGFHCPQRADDDVGHDERAVSLDLARQLGTDHHEFILNSGHLESALDQLVWHLDYPTAGISYQVMHLARFVKNHVTVVLSGTGGDELFGGYPWRYEPIMGCPKADFEDVYYDRWVRFFNDDDKRALFQRDWNDRWAGFNTRERFSELLNPTRGQPNLRRALTFDFSTFLQGLLTVEDKLTMAHSLESRVPFLDNAVLNLASRIPDDLKATRGEAKVILKEAMRPLLPPDTLGRRKQGFTPPEQSWFRGPNRNFIHRILLSSDSRLRIYFRPDRVRQIMDEFQAGHKNHRQLIWSMLLLERWHRIFLEELRPAA